MEVVVNHNAKTQIFLSKYKCIALLTLSEIATKRQKNVCRAWKMQNILSVKIINDFWKNVSLVSYLKNLTFLMSRSFIKLQPLINVPGSISISKRFQCNIKWLPLNNTSSIEVHNINSPRSVCVWNSDQLLNWRGCCQIFFVSSSVSACFLL